MWAVNPHQSSMPYLWSFVIDLAVFVVLYKYRPLWMISHVIIGLGVAFVTLLFTFPIYQVEGLPQLETADHMRRHIILGLVMMSIVLVQILFGIASTVLKALPKGSAYGIYISNRVHRYMGYFLVVLAKVQIYLKMDQDGTFWALLVVDLLLMVTFIIQKLVFPSMAESIIPDYERNAYNKVRSLKELRRSREGPVGIFGNYVFDLNNMLMFHPAGYRII